MRELADHFYASQHETGYMEGGALVAYMVERWGWEAFSAFYRDIHPQPSGSQAEAIEASLLKHFNLTLADLEAGFLERLRQEPVDAGTLEDVRQTVNYYDTVRRYQELLDPSAYYMTAWLPDPGEMQRRGIVADYLRQPVEPANLALETLLAETGVMLKQETYAEVERNLAAVNRVLDGVQAGEREPFARDAKARDYYQEFGITEFSLFHLVPMEKAESGFDRLRTGNEQAEDEIKGRGAVQVQAVKEVAADSQEAAEHHQAAAASQEPGGRAALLFLGGRYQGLLNRPWGHLA